MIQQDSTRNFLLKPPSAPFENLSPVIKEKKETEGSRDSAKKKFIEKFVPKAVKGKDPKSAKSKSKEKTAKKVAKKTKSDPVEKKEQVQKKKSTELKVSKEIKDEKQESDSVFRFNDIISNSQTKKVYPGEKEVPLKLFSNHQLKQFNTHPQPTNKENTDWIFITLLLAYAAFIWVKVFYNKIFIQISQAFFNNRITNQIVRDENILVQKASVLLTIIFYLVASLFIYQISILYDWNPDYVGTGFNRFLIFAFAISLIYTIKLLILKVVGHVFMVDKAIVIYIFNIFLINNLLGIALLPVLTFISFSHVYTEYAVYLAFVLIGGAFFYRLIRGCLIGLTYSRFSILYLFLYLCALEIAPLLVLIKILILRDF